MTGTFDGSRQLTLMLGARTGLAPRANFAIIGHEAAQALGLFVIDHRVFIGAELALSRPGEKSPAAGWCFVAAWLIAHFGTPLCPACIRTDLLLLGSALTKTGFPLHRLRIRKTGCFRGGHLT